VGRRIIEKLEGSGVCQIISLLYYSVFNRPDSEKKEHKKVEGRRNTTLP
jgi:hypothetical protein